MDTPEPALGAVRLARHVLRAEPSHLARSAPVLRMPFGLPFGVPAFAAHRLKHATRRAPLFVPGVTRRTVRWIREHGQRG